LGAKSFKRTIEASIIEWGKEYLRTRAGLEEYEDERKQIINLIRNFNDISFLGKEVMLLLMSKSSSLHEIKILAGFRPLPESLATRPPTFCGRCGQSSVEYLRLFPIWR